MFLQTRPKNLFRFRIVGIMKTKFLAVIYVSGIKFQKM